MISFSEAIERIKNNTHILSPAFMPLRRAGGLVLAEDVYANIDIPSFNQSAMDGYAFKYTDLLQTNEFIITGEVAAGDVNNFAFSRQQAVRIFTGAAVPEGFDTVVMQEKTEVQNNHVIIKDNMLVRGSNVRQAGLEIKKGELALSKGIVLTPAAIGFLATLGTTQIKVHPMPVVHIIVTGKELQQAGDPLAFGQVYESNGIMLQTALDQLHITDTTIVFTGDDVDEITNAIAAALQTADMILLTGGVSVGKYDFVIQAAEACGVKKLFHKVAQRPGKPLYAGKKDEKLVFGLPGNPASVLSCFYSHVATAIEGLTGRKEILERKTVPLLSAFDKKNALRQVLKGSCTKEGVLPLPAQESFRLSSFSVANCLISLPEESKKFREGDVVEVLLLPYL